MGFTYNFPRPKSVPGEDGYTQAGLANDIIDLAANVNRAAAEGDQADYLNGLLKLCQLCENGMREFDANVVSSAYFTHLSLQGERR